MNIFSNAMAIEEDSDKGNNDNNSPRYEEEDSDKGNNDNNSPRYEEEDSGHVEGNPVFIYLDAFGEDSDKDQIEELKKRYQNGEVGDVEVKKYLVAVLNRFLEPIRIKRAEYLSQPELIDKILKEGTEKVRAEAQKTLEEVKKAMKIDYFK